ncbi:2Fe-2S iron-sulfur cluster-binding protein [Rhodanobacter sp. AS-Z3]|uniref:2Fe-2S iron-sulfur cluster-binding protein n=1 Tax=Rhodanobacter sp. AS-Z3 TaxID=3031330 RepID=UPI00247938FB|nr:2Fe-2S iron-sulfur cluster-binding protein [Rhodanobacter sp. AS-Z3]WEN15028.1 2Fe-2S iron-sulfur cluster-binding protein [Rhodanobacter sp. AS-Z3]
MKTVNVLINGQAVAIHAEASVAAAIAMAGPAGFRRSLSGQPRAPLCGMGVCFECRVRINDTEHVRACMTPVAEGMQVHTHD